RPRPEDPLRRPRRERLSLPGFVIVRAAAGGAAAGRAAATRVSARRRPVFAIPADAEGLPGALAERAARPGTTVAYRCTGTRCSLPIESLDALAAELSSGRS